MNEPYRTPDAVLALEQQLRDKASECEDLRAENLKLKTKLAARDPLDAKDARAQWTNRLLILGFAVIVLSVIFVIFRYAMAPTVEGACRDAVIRTSDINPTCPYGGQVATLLSEDRLKCTCPTPAAAGSPSAASTQ